MADQSPDALGLLRIVAYLPWLAKSGAAPDGSDVTYIASDGHSHVIVDMANGYLHSACAKLKREGRLPATVAAMEVEIERRGPRK